MRASKVSLRSFSLLLILALVFVSCGKPGDGEKKAESEAQAHNPQYEMITSMGKIVLELDSEHAPVGTANFDQYVQNKYYDGTIFHRVISNFMIQGGGFDANLVKKETLEPIINEAANGLKNMRGTLCYARTNVINSATSQFFINVQDNDFLNFRDSTARAFGYAVFGKVIEGMDIVDAIRNVETGQKKGPEGRPMGDVPVETVTIESVRKLK